MAFPSSLSRASLALAGVLLLGSGTGWSQGNPQGRPGKGQPMIEALSRLSPTQRSAYLQAQRSLEESRSRERLAQIEAADRCLAQASGLPAIQSCWQTLAQGNQQLRAQQVQQQQALAQRFALPVPRAGAKQKGG
jgi:hypothetical protein